MPGPIRVLHVEDDPEFADLTHGLLERQDRAFAIDHVLDPASGLERLEREAVDCIVSDFDLGNENGIDFLAAVREEYADLPFILFTGKGSEEVASEAISTGVTDYLQKGGDPSRFEVLANRIENAVDQYRSKRALQRSENRLSLFFDQSPLGVIEWNDDFAVERMNAAAEDILGYAESELVGASWERIVPPEDRSEVEHVLDELGADQGGYQHVNENCTKDGDRIVCEWHNRVVTDRSGEVVAVFSQFQDITDRRQHERQIERTNAMLSTLVDALPVGIIAEDDDRRVVAVNERLFELLDLPGSPDEVVGQHSQALHESANEAYADPDILCGRFDEGGEIVEVPLADGRVLLCSHARIGFPDGEGSLWVFNDITDRIEYEETVTALHGVARDLARCSAEEDLYQHSIDAAGSLLEFDQAVIATEADGYLHVRAMSEDVPFDEPPTMKADEGLAGKSYQTGEAILVDDAIADEDALPQSERVHSGISVPIGDRGVFQVIDDTPGAFEERDVELVRLLARHVESALALLDRERELQRQNDRLEAFASVVSHDLRSPLNVAEGRLDLARGECESEYLDDLAESHQRMQELINDVLDLARGGRPITDMETIELQAITKRSWHHVETETATLEFGRNLTMRSDRSRLTQLLENVFRNAIEHGGRDVTVRVGALPTGGFYVEDDGSGIPAESREMIFDGGFTTSSSGTGFGLAIVEEIVEAHDWSISVCESDAGGTRFEITGVERVH